MALATWSPTTWSMALGVAVGIAGLAGCSMGPESVLRDRFDYNSAISNSWKEQSLLNIVKIRYADMPLFLDVASVVAGYTMETSVNAGATLPSSGSDTFIVGGSGRFTDRPTITYSPITGEQFSRSFMTPIPPQAVLFLLQAGWSADLVLGVTVDSMNGLRSRISGGTKSRRGDDGFYRAIKLIRAIQDSGALGMRIEETDEQETKTLLFFHRDDLLPEDTAILEELRRLLRLDPGTWQLRVTYSQLPEKEGDLALLTRSMIQIIIDLSGQIDVPEEHVADGRTRPSLALADGEEDPRTLHVHFSRDRPEHSFVHVRYRGYWYYIDDRDFTSKRTFAFLMLLFSLTETGGREGLPLVTIPAG